MCGREVKDAQAAAGRSCLMVTQFWLLHKHQTHINYLIGFFPKTESRRREFDGKCPRFMWVGVFLIRRDPIKGLIIHRRRKYG